RDAPVAGEAREKDDERGRGVEQRGGVGEGGALDRGEVEPLEERDRDDAVEREEGQVAGPDAEAGGGTRRPEREAEEADGGAHARQLERRDAQWIESAAEVAERAPERGGGQHHQCAGVPPPRGFSCGGQRLPSRIHASARSMCRAASVVSPR